MRLAFTPEDRITPKQAKPQWKSYQEIRYHIIFDIKMDSKFTRKTCIVAGGHTPEGGFQK